MPADMYNPGGLAKGTAFGRLHRHQQRAAAADASQLAAPPRVCARLQVGPAVVHAAQT